MNLSLSIAETVVTCVLKAAREHAFKPLTVTVLDAGGHVVVAAREDGCSNKRFEVAFGKAHGALALGMGSRGLMKRAEEQAYFVAAVTDAAGPLIPVPGGVLIRAQNGALLGAVGVSGDTSDNDETAAMLGIAAAGLVGQPE